MAYDVIQRVLGSIPGQALAFEGTFFSVLPSELAEKYVPCDYWFGVIYELSTADIARSAMIAVIVCLACSGSCGWKYF